MALQRHEIVLDIDVSWHHLLPPSSTEEQVRRDHANNLLKQAAHDLDGEIKAMILKRAIELSQ